MITIAQLQNAWHNTQNQSAWTYKGHELLAQQLNNTNYPENNIDIVELDQAYAQYTLNNYLHDYQDYNHKLQSAIEELQELFHYALEDISINDIAQYCTNIISYDLQSDTILVDNLD